MYGNAQFNTISLFFMYVLPLSTWFIILPRHFHNNQDVQRNMVHTLLQIENTISTPLKSVYYICKILITAINFWHLCNLAIKLSHNSCSIKHTCYIMKNQLNLINNYC